MIGRHLTYGNGQEAEAKVILLFQSSPVPKGPTTWEGHAQVLLPATNGEMQGKTPEMLPGDKKEDFPDNHWITLLPAIYNPVFTFAGVLESFRIC